MRTCLIFLTVCLLPSGPALAQVSPYAGHEHRDVKALSPEDIAAYLAGDGMGFAMAAELNHYPGPRHVIDLATTLGLTQDQLARVEAIFREMSENASTLGKQIVEEERALDGLFASGDIRDSSLMRLVQRIASLNGALRITHLQAHLRVRESLTPAQVAAYDEARGYGTTHRH